MPVARHPERERANHTQLSAYSAEHLTVTRPPAATSAPTRRALADSTISGLSRELPHSQTKQQTLHCCNAHPLVLALKSEALDAVPMHPMTPDVHQPLRREYHPRNAQTAVVMMPSATMIATASPESVLPPLVSCSSRPILRTAGRT